VIIPGGMCRLVSVVRPGTGKCEKQIHSFLL
jgi:hypothetical protein